MRPRRWLSLATAVGGLTLVALPAPTALADSLTVDGKQIPNVKIEDVHDGEIWYTTDAGLESHKPIATVSVIDLADLPAIGLATTAAQANDPATAALQFAEVLRTEPQTGRLWLRTLAAQRLLDTSSQQNRIDLEAQAFVALVQIDPALVANFTPACPDPKSDYLHVAADLVQKHLDDAGLKPPQKISLNQFLYAIHQVLSDSKSAEADVDRLGALDPNNPLFLALTTQRTLASMRDALAAGKFEDVTKISRDNPDRFTADADQLQALYLIAQADQGLANASNRPSDFNDAALAYTRVFANFASGPGVSASLLAAANILADHLADKPSADRLYKEILARFPDSPEAQTAQDKLK